MSNILISPPPTTLLTGLLQLSGGVAMSSTPVYVTDQNNTASKLSLGTNNVGINTTSTFARLTIANTNTLASEYLLSASTSTASFYVRNDGYLYNAERGRISNILIAQQGTNSLSSTLSGGSGGCLWLGTNGTAITNTTNLTPTAMAHIKGSGSTSATTSLLVQNSAGNNSISTTDDGKTLLTATITNDAPLQVNNAYGWTGSFTAKCQSWLSAGSEVARIMANGSMILTANITASTFKATQNIPSDVSFGGNGSGNGMYMPASNVTAIATSSTERMRIDSSGNMGLGTSTPAYQMTQARYGIPTYFLVNTSLQDAGTVGQVVGNLQFGFYPNSTTTSHGAIRCITDGSWASGCLAFFTQGGDGTVSLATEKMRLSPAGNLGIGITSISSRLQVQGSGTTSATTNTLLQNSSATQLIKVTDDGKMTMGTGTTGTALLDIAVGSGSTPPLRLKGYSDAGTSYLISAGTESFADNFKVKMVNGNVTMGTQLNGYTFGLETFNGVAMHIANAGNIGMGTTSPNVSAKLEVNSTTQGFLPPKMTTAQKLLIGTPASGLMVYDTSLNQMSYYNGGAWVNF
jgi:hypothetical protein